MNLPNEYDGSRGRRGRMGPPRAQNYGTALAPSAGVALPYSLEAEEHLLACCLIDDGHTVGRAFAAGVGEASFYEGKNAAVWRALEKLWQRKSPTGVVCLAEELKARGEFEEVGGYAFLTQVSACESTTAQADYLVERVVDLALNTEVACSS